MSNSQSSDSEWDGDDVIEEDDVDLQSQTTCLFCPEVLPNPEEVFSHCHTQHKFDIALFCQRTLCDSISYIKFVNYARIHNPSVCDLQSQLNSSEIPWNDDLYMKPAQSDDPLLTFDIESFVDEHCSNQQNINKDTVVLARIEYEALLHKMNTTQVQLENAWDRIERMKETAKTVLYSANHFSEKTPRHHHHQQNDMDNYFSSYDHFGIHHEMLQDKVRTLAYQDAIVKNHEEFAGKRVMDLGCGTAILSMFAASAGAAKVLAIDQSDIIYQAMDIVRENQMESSIDLFKGRVEDIHIPEKVDIIVSEWMGYFLLFEGMLDSVIHARDLYLAPNGLLLPDRATISIAAVSDSDKYDEYVTFWSDVYGYKMSIMRRELIKEANVETVKAEKLCSNCVIVKEFDLMTCGTEDTEFVSKFDLTMTKDCKVTSIAGFFDAMFEKNLKHKVILSTSPMATETHWKQTVFLLPKPVEVKEGEVVSCRLSCRKNRRDPRTLIVKIDFGDSYNLYYLS